MSEDEAAAAALQGTHYFDSLYRSGQPRTRHQFVARSIFDLDRLGNADAVQAYHGVQFTNPLVATSRSAASEQLLGRNAYPETKAKQGEDSPEARAVLAADDLVGDAAEAAGYDAIVTPGEVQVIDKARLPSAEGVKFVEKEGHYTDDSGRVLYEGIGLQKARERARSTTPPPPVSAQADTPPAPPVAKPTLQQYDSPEAHKAYKGFKTKLTRLQNAKDHHGVIALWKEFEEFYDSRNWPQPDAWRNWERGAEDAQYELDRQGSRGHFADITKPVGAGTPQLSTDLKGAKPRFNVGPHAYEPQFESDVDLAAYILAQKTPSKRDADYLKFVQRETGLDADQARQLGQQVKARIRDLVKGTRVGVVKGGPVQVPQIWQKSIGITPRSEIDAAKPVEVVTAPEGYRLQEVTRIAGEEARIKGGEYTVVAQRISPFSAVRGYGTTAEEAQRDALRRVGALAKPETAAKPTPKPASEMSDEEIADAIMAQLAAEQKGEKSPEQYHATQRGVAYEDMTDVELLDLAKDGVGDEVSKAASEMARRAKVSAASVEISTPPQKNTSEKSSPTIRYNSERKSVEIKFAAKPSPETLSKLKDNGYKWAKTNQHWYKTQPVESRAEASIKFWQKELGIAEPAAEPKATDAEPKYVLPSFVTNQYRKPKSGPVVQTPEEHEAYVKQRQEEEKPRPETYRDAYRTFIERGGVVAGEKEPERETHKLTYQQAARIRQEVIAAGGQKAEKAAGYSPAPRPESNADLDARKAANKAKRDALAKELAKDLGTTLNTGMPDPKHVKAMVGIVRTYLDDGIVEFERAWRQFKEEYSKLAPMLERPFEIAWQMLRQEDKKVADIPSDAPKSEGKKEESEGNTAEVPADDRARKLFYVFEAMIREDKQLPKDPRELRKLAQRFVGGDPTTYTDDITDAVEAALTYNVRGQMAIGYEPVRSQIGTAIEKARALEEKLPRAARSLEKLDLQQFSTPLPLAVAAQYAAHVRRGDRVLEPTAGTGHLVSALDPTKYNVLVRELSERRVSLLKALGFHTTQGDYLQAIDLKEDFNVIITNPPWGKYSKGKYGAAIALDFTPVDVAERFIAKNVRDLKPGGRLVAVMPTTMMRSPGFRTFLNKHGSVRAIIQSPPGAYETRSTSVDSILLVWDKVKLSDAPRESEEFRAREIVSAVGPNAPNTWEEYADLVGRVPARPAITEGTRGETTQQTASGRPGEATRPSTEPVRGGSGSPGSSSARPGSDAPIRTPRVPTGRQPDVVADQPGGERGELGPRGTTPRLAREDTRDATRGLSDNALAAYREAGASQHFAPYRLRSDLAGVRHPKLVVEARALSGVPYPELTIEPSAKVRDIVKAGRVSIEQAEQALAAVQANVVGQHGYLAADNVGVGKSREIALTIIELMERAKAEKRDLRLMVTTHNQDTMAGLIDTEMLQEVLGGEEPDFEIIKVTDNKDAKKDGDDYKPLPRHKHAIYVVDSFNLRDYRQALMDVGLHGIIGDEVHAYKNADAKVGATWQTLHARIMIGVPRKEQAFAYFTATPAQSVYDYRYLYGLREWPVDGFSDWINIITGSATEGAAAKLAEDTERGAINPTTVANNTTEKVVGGDAEDTEQKERPKFRSGPSESVFMQALSPSEAEQIPREWKVKGKFSSRDLWRKGTEFVVETRPLKSHHEERYDKFAALARDIFAAHRKFGKMDKSGARSMFGPGSALQNASKRLQMQPAIEEAIDIAKEHLAQGYQPVLSLINVNEADPEGGNLRAAIEQINTREVDKTEDGEIIDVGDIPEAIIAKSELLEQAKALGLLDNPLTMVTDAFGPDKVALIVGGTGKKRTIHAREFQEGKRPVAVISAAGTTGINLDHRVKTKGGAQGRRVFIDVQYEWSATKSIQRYGRVDRSASLTQPKIIALNFGSAAEKKFLATVANRMASLGALSKGGAESTGASALEEFEITGSDSLQAARDAWAKLSDDDKMLWVGRVFRDPGNTGEVAARSTQADMRQIQLALLWLPLNKSNAFWESFLEERARIRDAMGYLDERRAKQYKGEILRAIEADPQRTIYQVKNENGERFGILQGLVMGDMPRIAPHLRTDRGLSRRYVTFTAHDGRVVAGLEIPWMRVKGVARLFGAMVAGEKLDTPEKVTEALHAGEKVELAQKTEDGKPWVIRERNDGKIAIDGVKMADRNLVSKYGVGFSPVGNYWFVTDLPTFLERFPTATADVSTEVTDENPDGEDLAMPRVRGGSPRALPIPPLHTTKPFEPAKHRQGAVIAQLRKRLGGIPVSVGRLHSDNNGIYKSDTYSGGKVVRGAQAIRLRYADNLLTAMHEFGHHIDFAILKIDRGDARWSDELIDLGLPTSKKGYTDTQKRKEGAAEFFRLYIMDPATAQKEAPEYFAEFERRLNKPDQKALKDALLEAREGAEAFFDQQHETRGESRVRTADEMPGAIRQIASEIVDDPSGAKSQIGMHLMSALVDDLQPLKMAVRNMAKASGQKLAWMNDAYVLARLARGSAMRSEAFLDDGVRGLDGQFLGPSLQSALKLVGKENYQQFGQYLVALRVLEVRERGIETGMKASEAKAIIEKAEKSPVFEKFEQARPLVYSYQRALLEYMQVHGALNSSQVAAITKFAELYVPLQRVMDEAQSYLGGGARKLVNRSSPIFRLMGSSRDIIDPFESIVKNTLAIVDMVEKNRAAQALVELAEQSPGSAKYLEALPAPQAATKFNLTQLKDQIRGALDNMGLGDAIPDNFEDALNQLVTVFTPVHFARGKENKENIVTVVRDGERQFWQIHNEDLAGAIANIGVKEAGILAQFGAFGKGADWLAGGATKALRFTATTTPTFMLRNLTRDTLGAFLQSRYGFIPVWDNIRVAKELVQGKSEESQLFKAAGVQQATQMGYDRQSRAQIVKNMRDRRSLYHPIDLLRTASMFIESSTRFAEFKNALAAGGEERGITSRLLHGSKNRSTDEESLTRAALAARDVSTDFSRGGYVTRELNRYYAFMNARVQGYARIAETIKRDPAGVAMKVGSLAAMSWLLALANDDDKEYQQKTESEKHAAWFWRVDPDKPFIEIQKPFEWGYAADLTEATVEWIKRNDPTRFRKIKDEWTPSDLQASILRMAPTVALPLLEAGMNYSLFRGGPIVSPFDLDLPNDQIYNDFTSETSKLLGRVMDLPPAFVDHILVGYTSTMGRETIAMTDLAGGKAGVFPERNLPSKAIQQYPFFGAFIDDARFTGQAREIQDLYEAADEVEALERGIRREANAGRREDARERYQEAQSESELFRRREAIKAVRKAFRDSGKRLKAIHALSPQVASPERKAAMIYREREKMVDLAALALGRRVLPSRKAAGQ